ncbi:MAG: glutaminyl-peptide cyclotransferase, partial [Polaribacter sp.]|nr:glutaminyl-peptide cyclotransferase [Polaribacter sp.]
MNKTVLYTYLVLLIILSSCSKDYKFKLNIDKKTTLNKTLSATLTEDNNQKVDSIQFYINGKSIKTEGNSTSIETSNLGVGKHSVSALAFYPGKTKKTNNSFEVF